MTNARPGLSDARPFGEPAADQGRDLEIHDPAQGREGVAVRVSHGSEIGDHTSGAGDHVERSGLLRDLRAGLVGQWQHPAGRGVGGRRAKLGAGGWRKLAL